MSINIFRLEGFVRDCRKIMKDDKQIGVSYNVETINNYKNSEGAEVEKSKWFNIVCWNEKAKEYKEGTLVLFNGYIKPKKNEGTGMFEIVLIATGSIAKKGQ